jgi:benzoate membrane transport protein
MRVLKDFSASTITAGFVAALIGVSSSMPIVFSAALAFGANDAEASSWVWAVCIGMAALTIVPSLKLRAPVMVAYSIPGAVILVTLKPGTFTLAEGVGAFIVTGVLMALVGFTGWFERAMNRIPIALASAMLSGVLVRFALTGFADAASAPWMIVITTLTYLVLRATVPRFAVIGVLIAGVATAVVSGTFTTNALRWSVARPTWTSPSFTWSAAVSIALPLFIVTMAGQNMPGIAVIRNSPYDIPVSKVIGASGVGTIVLAPFGGFALNLSAVTAAICMEPAAHEDPARRYTAAVANGLFYLAVGVFGASITGMLNAFPIELVHIIAALALLPTMAANLANATQDDGRRDAAVLTFLVTLSGVTVARIGAPFWGAVAGIVATVLSSRLLRDRVGRVRSPQ